MMHYIERYGINISENTEGVSPMAEFGKNLKGIWLKGMEAISNTASNIASNTKYKVDEMNIVNRRREILSDFGAQAYELWQKGERFPDALETLLKELSALDEQLNAIRTEKLAGVKTDDGAEPATDAEQEDTAQPEEDGDVPTLEVPEEAAEAEMEAEAETEAEKLEEVPTISYTAAAEDANMQPEDTDAQVKAPEGTEPEA